MNLPIDTLGRPLHDLRISVTDRCNFRCTYCMPKEVFGRGYQFLPREQLLSFEEITRLAGIFTRLGVRKVRLTGGEPLMRRDLPELVRSLRATPGVEDLALTTNGSFPLENIARLKQAGLTRMTVSLDALDEAVFKAMNDVDFPVAAVLDWIAASAAAGLGPVKVNMVVKRGVNDHEILPMARYMRKHGHILRLIEFMDVGSTNGWRMDDVVTARQIFQTIHAELSLEPLQPNYRGEVAERYRYTDGGGEVGIIASVSQPFCGDCTRARLSADGKLFTCLFAVQGADLRQLLRDGASDAELSAAVAAVWARRADRYSELRSRQNGHSAKVEMSYIGG